MEGFGGFGLVREGLQREFRDSLETLAVRPLRVEGTGVGEHLVATDLSSGKPVLALVRRKPGTLPAPGLLAERVEQAAGGSLVLQSCRRNRLGMFEASDMVAFPPGNPVFVDGVARVTAPFRRGDGEWRQSIQHLRTGSASVATDNDALLDAVLSALGEPGPGRAVAFVRGLHARGGSMAFEVGATFDPDMRSYLNPEASLDAFLACPDVRVLGLETSASGASCIGIVNKHCFPGSEVSWEVIPKRIYSLGNKSARDAASGGRDMSAPYRFAPGDPSASGTGCLPTVVAMVSRDTGIWPRVCAPSRPGIPVPELKVRTALSVALPAPNARPRPAIRRPVVSAVAPAFR